MPAAISDNAAGAAKAAAQIISQGPTKLAYLGDRTSIQTPRERRRFALPNVNAGRSGPTGQSNEFGELGHRWCLSPRSARRWPCCGGDGRIRRAGIHGGCRPLFSRSYSSFLPNPKPANPPQWTQQPKRKWPGPHLPADVTDGPSLTYSHPSALAVPQSRDCQSFLPHGVTSIRVH